MSEDLNKQLSENEVINMFLSAEKNINEATVKIPRINGMTVTLRGLYDDEIERLRERCTIKTKIRGNVEKETDVGKFQRCIIDKATIGIGGVRGLTFAHEKFREPFKALEGEMVIKGMLLAGEIAMLHDKVLELSGFYDRVEEVEDLKKSSADAE